MRPVTDQQVRKLMEEMTKTQRVGMASQKAGMHRSTGTKYLKAGALPSELTTPRTWRTREDPFAERSAEIEAMLAATPELEAKTIFEHLLDKYPGRYEAGQLRTLQRKVLVWRAAHGPEREVRFGQRHRPGEALQLDFTYLGELGITIAGVLVTMLLCTVTLPFSNWVWATLVQSESLAALRKGLQRALFQLGRVPTFAQTDNSSAATHRIPEAAKAQAPGIKRPFNAEYLALVAHFGLKPRTIEVGKKEQNGDVESLQGALKRRLTQSLLLRGHRDFDDTASLQSFVDAEVRKMNDTRGARLVEELAAMQTLKVARLPDYQELVAEVSEWSTIRIKDCAYSVPSRLIGRVLDVRLYEDRIEASFAGRVELACERQVGRNRHHIDYRHVIWSLVRKPGAFARYVYRDAMFPALVFRRAYDAIQAAQPGTRGDVEYLRILHLAASTLEAEVGVALELLLGEGRAIEADAVKAMVQGATAPALPAMAPLVPDLSTYDALLSEVGT